MNSNPQEFKWARRVVDCMKQLQAEGFRFVDQEVVPNFDGTPNGIFAWFICEHEGAREEFDLQLATEALTHKLRDAGFPHGAVEILRTGVTSQAEIQAGGGRFYFFR